MLRGRYRFERVWRWGSERELELLIRTVILALLIMGWVLRLADVGNPLNCFGKRVS